MLVREQPDVEHGASLDRTYEELKRASTHPRRCMISASLDRTYEELKLVALQGMTTESVIQVWIVPMRN